MLQKNRESVTIESGVKSEFKIKKRIRSAGSSGLSKNRSASFLYLFSFFFHPINCPELPADLILFFILNSDFTPDSIVTDSLFFWTYSKYVVQATASAKYVYFIQFLWCFICFSLLFAQLHFIIKIINYHIHLLWREHYERRIKIRNWLIFWEPRWWFWQRY